MACRKCGSDWKTPTGNDCNRCPHCDKQQLFQARKQGRWVEPTQVKQCVQCEKQFTAVGVKHIKQKILCDDPACRKAHRKAGSKRRRSGLFVGPRPNGKCKEERFCKRCGKGPLGRNQKEYCGRKCAGSDAREFKRGFMGQPAELRRATAFASWFVDYWEPQRPRRRKLYKTRPPCQKCGKEINSGSSRFCSYWCFKNWRGIRQCDVCGVDVPNSNSFSKCRCDTCKERLRKESNRKGKNRCGRNHRQRARHHGVSYTPVPVKAVYERDGYRCQICMRRCLKSAMFSKIDGRIHPLSPTIDHIVPMACGGNHEPGNLQTACHACNSAKGARAAGQLRMAFL